MRSTLGKLNRSKLYHTITSLHSVNNARTIRLDVWGSVVVLLLVVGIINLMRFVIAH